MEGIDSPKVLAVVPLRAASRFDTAKGGVLWSDSPRVYEAVVRSSIARRHLKEFPAFR
jgi:hypothetical protein